MKKPNQIGKFLIENIELETIIPFIDWRFYFVAWRIPGKFDNIERAYNEPAYKEEWINGFAEKDREKAGEAFKLFADTQDLLQELLRDRSFTLNATYSIYPARSKGEDIFVDTEEGELIIPTLRQQKPSTDGFCYSLADFLAEEDDYIGVFANTVIGGEALAAKYEESDVYKAIIVKTFADRLAEAVAEWLHWKIRKEFWGYAADEVFDIEGIHKVQYTGIRPAVGYPSLPDQSLIFEMKKLLYMDEAGMSLTENGAMYPNASVSGFLFDHPKSKYFMIGKIDEEQLRDYAKRRNQTEKEMRKWLAANL